MTTLNLAAAKTALNNSINAAMGVSDIIVAALDSFYSQNGDPSKLGHVLQAINDTGYEFKQRDSYNLVIGVISQFAKYEIKREESPTGGKTPVLTTDGDWIVKKDVKLMLTLAKRQGVDVDGLSVDTAHEILVEKLWSPMAEKWEAFKDSYTDANGVTNIFGEVILTESEKETLKAEKKAKSDEKKEKAKAEFPTAKGMGKVRDTAEKNDMTSHQFLMTFLKDSMLNDPNFSISAFLADANALAAE